VVELFFHHLAELDFAVAVIPFAAALLAGYALVRSGFPRRALVFAAVAVASVFWFLLEVAVDAAAYDSTDGHPKIHSRFVDLPRIHERYMIYLFPFFLVALFCALPLFRKEIAPRVHGSIAVVAALLPALIPFGTVINGTTAIDSFSLLSFTTTAHSRDPVPITHATVAVVGVSAFFALAYFLAAIQPFPAIAVLMTVFGFVWLSGHELQGQLSASSVPAMGLPAHGDWVDRVVGHKGDVSLISGPEVRRTLAANETAFWNASVVRVYYTCSAAFGAGFGEKQLVAGDEIRTRYAVVPASLEVPGRVLARDPPGKLVLVAPESGVVRIPPAVRCRA
jgi:hypothetical protein